MTSKPRIKCGPKPGPEGVRIRLEMKPLVNPSTAKIIRLMSKGYGCPVGRLLDAVIAFAVTHPEFKLQLKGKGGVALDPRNAPNALETQGNGV